MTIPFPMRGRGVPRKIDGRSVLKKLSERKQGEIMAYIEGSGGNEPHSLEATAEWLRGQGIPASADIVGNFRRWYLMREELRRNEGLSLELAKECKERGWVKSAREERAAAQVFFNRVALERGDAKLWALMERTNLYRDKVALERRKLNQQLKLYGEVTGRKKKKVEDAGMTADEKEEAVNRILGIT